MTTREFLADLVVVIHLAFVVFVAAGGLLVLRWPKVAWFHVPSAIWGALIIAAGSSITTSYRLSTRADFHRSRHTSSASW